MSVNANPYFKVYPGDDTRMLRGLKFEAIGLFCTIRLWAHDARPYAHLVTPTGSPLTDGYLTGELKLSAKTYRKLMADLRACRALQTSAEWLTAWTEQNARAAQLVVAARELVSGCTDPEKTLVVTCLAEQRARSDAGKKYAARGGGNPALRGGTLVRFERAAKGVGINPSTHSPPLTPGVIPPAYAPPLRGSHNTHGHDTDRDLDSDSAVDLDSAVNPPLKERKTATTARTREAEAPERPMTWVAYTARCREISVWHEHYIEPLGGVTQERLDALFNAKFQMGPWSVWVEIQRLMEASIPQSCGEGKHTFRDGLTTCAKCPETRVDESVVS